MSSVELTESKEDCTEYEKPLSPVLNQTKGNRKILVGRRIHSKKARVKLLNSFEKAGGLSENVSRSDTSIPNSFTEGQTLKLLEREEQTSNQGILKSCSSKENQFLIQDENSCFKKPISPAPHAKKIVEHRSKNLTLPQPSSNICYDPGKEVLRSDNINFQTASGKNIKICDRVLKAQQKLFEDILDPGVGQREDTRKNKYSFLSKTGNKIEINKSNKPSCIVDYLSKKKQLETDSPEKKIGPFTQEITDSGITNTQIESLCDEILSRSFDVNIATSPTLKSKSVIVTPVDTSREKQLFENAKSALEVAHSLCKTVQRKLVDTDDSLQNLSDNDFKGFSHMCIESSEKIATKLNKMLGNISYTTQKHVAVNTHKFSSERTIFSVHDKVSMPTSCSNSVKIEIIHSPPSKKTKIHNFSESETLSSCVENSSLYSSKTSCGDGRQKNKQCVLKMNDPKEYSGIDTDWEYRRDMSEQTLIGAGELINSKHTRITNIDEDANHSLLHSTKNQNVQYKTLIKQPTKAFNVVESGFQTASGNKLRIKEKLLVDAKKLYESCNMKETEELTGFIKQSTKVSTVDSGFQTASGNKLKIKEKLLVDANKLYESCNMTESEELTRFTKQPTKTSTVDSGFQTASGNKLRIKEKLLVDANKLYESCNMTETEELVRFKKHEEAFGIDNADNVETVNLLSNNPVKNSFNSCGFKTASGIAVQVSEKMLRNAKKMLESCNADVPFFEDASKCKTQLSNENLNTSTLHCHSPHKNVEADPSLTKGQTENLRTRNTTSQTRDYTSVSNPYFTRAKRLFADDTMSLKPEFSPLPSDRIDNVGTNTTLATTPNNKISLQNESMECDTNSGLDFSTNTNKSHNTSVSLKAKRRLGISSCKQINLSEGQLTKAKSVFKEDLSGVMPIWKSSPVSKLTETLAMQSTPIKHNVSHNISSFVNSTVTSINPNIETFIDTTITPIKPNNIQTLTSEVEEDYHMFTDAPVLIQKPTDGNIDKWMEDLEHERCLLQKKLEILTQRSLALRQQKQYLCHNTVGNIRKRLGVLSQRKLTKPRMKWLDLVEDVKPGDVKFGLSLNRLTEINPGNAECVHFNCLTGGIEDVITTADGGILIPNVKNLIGLSEVESAFKIMPGVEAKYIPNGWVRNHYRWIVWKLASYERSFPVQCEGCFSLENLMQQLKYRYDREIDKAERSALRKIYEKDDAPQKRMVLCICDIVKLSESKYDLVLTDGWYSIRTTIDDALCQQIDNGKIRIGTKLITYGAELLNCEGCYPLEATDMVRLKIFFNCTRRVKWYTKLGYYHISTPFPIPIESVNPAGGLVAYIKVYIARVYPVRYMERKDNITAWRNVKAELRRAQEWEKERLKKIDELQEQAYEECSTDYSLAHTNYSHQSTLKIKNITCPQTLYSLVVNSKDPEYIQGELSESQKKSIIKYQESIASSRQQRISSRISENLQKLKQLKRDVLPILKMVIVDIYKPSSRGVNLYIWNPTENHLQTLKEGKCFGIYNLIPKRNGDLSTNMKTKFEELSSVQKLTEKFARVVTPIASLVKLERNFLGEVDTIGVVVQTNIQNTSQDLWLTDLDEQLLHVKISEGPATCLLLDNIKRAQIICCSNLVMCQRNSAFAQAVANHFTIFTSHPQQKHLQEALDQFKRICPKNVNNILSACDIKIEEESSSNVSSKSISVLEDSTEDSTLIYSRITSTDIAMSLIDVDQYK